jgi:hypothetical protein
MSVYGDYIRRYPDIATCDLADLMLEEEAVDASRRSIKRGIRLWKQRNDWEEPEEVEEEAEELPGKALGLSELKRDYFYNELADLYIVWLPGRAKPVQVEGETVREMKRAYSDHIGKGATLNEIARRFGWRRKDFENFKRVMGWVHNEDPYTDEEHVTRDTSDLVEDLASLRRGEFEREVHKREWRETIKDARRWRELRDRVVVPLAEYVSTHPPRSRAQIPRVAGYQEPYMAVFCPSDLHIGKLGVDGYCIERARALVMQTTERLISQVQRYGEPERTLLVLGSDWSHIDNAMGGTTRGTLQDLDGLPGLSLVETQYEIAAELIDLVRQLGDVEVCVVPGNHDEWSSYHLRAALALAYRGEKDVHMFGDCKPRQYVEYGRSLLMLEHGDGAKPKDYVPIMAKERSEQWGRTAYRYAITGHLHHLKEQDVGVYHMQAPSLSGKDRWHDKKGYVTADRANVAYLFDRRHGHTARILAGV